METMLEFLIVIGVILLLAILFYVVKLYSNFNKDTKPVPNPVLPPVIDDEEYERIKAAREKAFFKKYANLTAKDPDGNIVRTVSFTQALIQAITIQVVSGPNSNVGARVPKPKGKITINEKMPWQLLPLPDVGKGQEQDQQQVITKSAKFTAGYVGGNCPSAEIDFDALVSGDAASASMIANIISPEQLGALCVCPSGDGYCNWSSEMFEQFIIDTNVWNLVSIEVFDILSGDLLSTSSMNQAVSSPQSHVLVQMSNPTVLQGLNSEDKIVVLFKWLDNVSNEQRCIELFNEMP